jgi:methionyl-tRNA synthetase
MTDAFTLWATQNEVLFSVLLIVAMIWTSIWKGISLWKSARTKQIIWFIVFIAVNTLGILEILYIFWFSKLKKK